MREISHAYHTYHWKIPLQYEVSIQNSIKCKKCLLIIFHHKILCLCLFSKIRLFQLKKLSPHWVFILGNKKRQFWNPYWISNNFHFLFRFLLIMYYRTVTQIFIETHVFIIQTLMKKIWRWNLEKRIQQFVRDSKGIPKMSLFFS